MDKPKSAKKPARIKKPLGKPRVGRNRIPESRFNKFLKVLSYTGIMRSAANTVGIHPDTIQVRKREDPEFATRVREALEKRYENSSRLLFSKYGEATVSELLKIMQFEYERRHNKDNSKISIRQSYLMLNRVVMSLIEHVEPERRSSALQAVDDAISQFEVTDITGGIRTVRNAITSQHAPTIENNVAGDDCGHEG